jgi:hypothetical protein
MLYEESDVFAKEDGNIVYILNLKLNLNPSTWRITRLSRKVIQLHSETSIQRGERICPKPTGERQGQEIHISIFIPVVCMHKKDSSLPLCVYFRELNRKTITDRHPLPRIQDLMDNLGGYRWFSILDQGSAYHQRLCGWKLKTNHPIQHPLGAIWVGPHPLWFDQHPIRFPEMYVRNSRGHERW